MPTLRLGGKGSPGSLLLSFAVWILIARAASAQAEDYSVWGDAHRIAINTGKTHSDAGISDSLFAWSRL